MISFHVNAPLEFEGGLPHESDINRTAALSLSDILITDLPRDSFAKIQNCDLKPDCVVVNFSSIPNFTDEAPEPANLYVPRVGPMTVVLCMRNTIRLLESSHQ